MSHGQIGFLARTACTFLCTSILATSVAFSDEARPSVPERRQRINAESAAALSELDEQTKIAFDRGDFKGALDARQKQLQITQKFYGADDWTSRVVNAWIVAFTRVLELSPADRQQIITARAAFTHARRSRDARRFNYSLEQISKAVAIYERLLGSDSAVTMEASQDLAEAYYYVGDYRKAKSRLVDDLPRVAKQGGKRFRDYAITLFWLALSERGLGEFEDAEKHTIEALDVYRYLEGQGPNAQVMQSFPNFLLLLAQVQNDLSKAVAAEAAVRECIERLNSSAPINAGMFGRLQTELARSLSLQGKYREADEIFAKQRRFFENLSIELPPAYLAPIIFEYALHLRRVNRTAEAEEQEALAKQLFEKAAVELEMRSASSQPELK
jgi:tetratricopeptide (TPR) repeat protein